MSPAEPAGRLSKVRAGQSITSEVIDFDWPITRSRENRPAASDARWISFGVKMRQCEEQAFAGFTALRSP
jgi:hypothetical protein